MSRVYELAVQLLARREHSTKELQRKLSQREFTEQESNDVLNLLQQQGLQSDDRFTEQYVRMRRNRGYGPMKIQAELRERGIDDELASCWLDASNAAWLDAAMQAWEKKFGPTVASDFNALNKQRRFMYYRGHSQSTIAEVEDEYR